MRAERLWIHHTEEIEGQLIGTILAWQALFFRIFQASEGKRGAQDASSFCRACLTLLARFALAFVRLKKGKKFTPVLICGLIITGHYIYETL